MENRCDKGCFEQQLDLIEYTNEKPYTTIGIFLDLWEVLNGVLLVSDMADTYSLLSIASGNYSASSAYKVQFMECHIKFKPKAV
jgi:hypothetical protein